MALTLRDRCQELLVGLSRDEEVVGVYKYVYREVISACFVTLCT